MFLLAPVTQEKKKVAGAIAKNACPLQSAGYITGMRIFFGVLFLLAALTARANPDAPSNCLVRLDQLVELVAELGQSASNDTGRANCIAGQLIKIKGLTSIAHALADAQTTHLTDASPTAAQGNQTMLLSACARAEKLAAAAADCHGTPNSSAPISPTESVSTSPAPPPVPTHATATSPIEDANCLSQIKLAALLAQAMDLEINPATETVLQRLTKQGLEPLGGWHAEWCVTLGDFCVVVAQALDLKVTVKNDPKSYIQAVRKDGLPVDELLARRPVDPLHEAAVRAFLSHGYAAPFPSSRQRQPD